MEKEDIRVTHVIIHILDSTVGTAVMSGGLLEHGSDFSDFLRSHIYRVMTSDEGKSCQFDGDSPVYQMVSEMDEDTFIQKSQEIAQKLFDIMYSNIDIPSADLMVTSRLFSQSAQFFKDALYSVYSSVPSTSNSMETEIAEVSKPYSF